MNTNRRLGCRDEAGGTQVIDGGVDVEVFEQAQFAAQQQGAGHVRGLHETVAHIHPIEPGAKFFHLEAPGARHHWDLFGHDAEQQDGFVQGLIELEVMQQRAWRAGTPAGEEDRGTRYPVQRVLLQIFQQHVHGQ